MQLPNFQIQMQNLPGAPAWFEQFLLQDQTWKYLVWQWSQGNVTPGDNLAEYIYTTTFQTPSNYASGGFNTFSFAVPFFKVLTPSVLEIGAIVDASNANIVGTTIVGFGVGGWSLNATHQTVTVNYICGLQANHKYAITLLVK